ncbi:hypothetical protein WN943_018153 [Citrus x changshan-huyou]
MGQDGGTARGVEFMADLLESATHSEKYFNSSDGLETKTGQKYHTPEATTDDKSSFISKSKSSL